MANRHRVKLKFEDIIAGGDLHPGVPGGFQAQTANGTALWRSLGWNQQYPDIPEREATPGGAWQEGRSNRSGE